MAMTLYGIRNCDTMKKARTWLDEHGVAYAFHDYKTAGIDAADLHDWIARVGWETMLEDSATTSNCPWKGVASYKTLVVDGKRNVDAVWYYPDPKSAAAEIKGRYAFWKGVTVG